MANFSPRSVLLALLLVTIVLSATLPCDAAELGTSGFISIDCGISEGSEYEDKTTTIPYTFDTRYIDTGTNHNISSKYMSGISSMQSSRQLSSLRSFPKGTKNCYTINDLAQARGNKFLIRATFMYGNYDSKNQLPEFLLYLDGDQWDIVMFNNASDIVDKEIIHTPATDYIHVCLVNNGSGTPFISVLEVRQLNNTIYKTQYGSLKLSTRLDTGSITNQPAVRYADDVYDRIWAPHYWPYWEPFSASYRSGTLSNNSYKPPSLVMSTAARPLVGSSLRFWIKADPKQEFYLYMHFAEIETLQDNQSRKFDIYLNNRLWYMGLVPDNLQPSTIESTNFVSSADGSLNFSLVATKDSTLPPILNALEIYKVQKFLHSPTNQSDVDAMRNIKSAYRVERNWQGDPCVPKEYLWDNLGCSYDSDSPKIISLNLSSSSLSGNMDASISGLKSLQSLDLSNNSLTGSVPDFLSQLPFLKTLNLSGNNFTGSVPSTLIEKSKIGSLILRTEGNLLLCQEDSCARPRGKKNRTKNYVIPIVASIASCLVLLAVILAIWWDLKRKKQREHILESNAKDEMLEEKNRQFTYAEVMTITNNFKTLLGKGAVGSVYAGQLPEGTQVAVKMLSPPSTQGSKQFRTEAQLLTKVHHRNLVSIIGYCNEGSKMGLIYEYMAKGTIKEHLSEKNVNILSWEQRLQIALDAAQALEYLHDGCKPQIIHRDIKTENILLTENMQAKISDFGISRLMPLDGTHISTGVAGTPGYMDPEYQVTNELNEKSDVYSFGTVLLELITGKRPILRSHENIHIAAWVRPMVERAGIKEIVDSRLNGDFDTNSAWKAVEIAMASVELKSIRRPLMRQIVEELRVCLEMEMARAKAAMENEKQFNPESSNPVVVDVGSSASGPSAR